MLATFQESSCRYCEMATSVAGNCNCNGPSRRQSQELCRLPLTQSAPRSEWATSFLELTRRRANGGTSQTLIVISPPRIARCNCWRAKWSN